MCICDVVHHHHKVKGIYGVSVEGGSQTYSIWGFKSPSPSHSLATMTQFPQALWKKAQKDGVLTWWIVVRSIIPLFNRGNLTGGPRTTGETTWYKETFCNPLAFYDAPTPIPKWWSNCAYTYVQYLVLSEFIFGKTEREIEGEAAAWKAKCKNEVVVLASNSR